MGLTEDTLHDSGGKPTIASFSVRSRAKRWRRLVGGLVVLAAALAVWAFFVEPARLTVLREDVPVPGIGLDLDGMRVAVLADLHVGAPHIDLDKLELVVAEANAAEPDLVVILGDFVITGVLGGEFVEPEPIAARLAQLRARYGVIAVLGNHDWWFDGHRVARALRDVGITVLADESVAVEGAPSLWVAGLEDLMTRAPDVDAAIGGVPDDAALLLLTHNPDVFPDVPDRVTLTLAGHTHGGQVCVPGYGPPVVPSRFGRRYARGHVVENGRHLWVSVGVGTSILPVRFLVTPSVDVLTLRRR